jgi:hypothetical protein
MAGTEKQPSTEPRNTVTMGAAVTQDSTFEWSKVGAQVTGGWFEKVALHAIDGPNGSLQPKHAAVQTPEGCWSSKLGDCEDIEHFSLEALNSIGYGRAVRFLRRPMKAGDPLTDIWSWKVV